MKTRAFLAMSTLVLCSLFAVPASADVVSGRDSTFSSNLPIIAVKYGNYNPPLETSAIFDFRSGNGQGDILAQTWNKGIWLPIRMGYYDDPEHGVGFSKACFKHNYCNIPVMNNVATKGALKYKDGRYTVDGRIIWYNKDYSIRAEVTAHNVYELKQGRRLPPGQIQGLITAYCLGPTVCPNWINSARPA